MPFVVPALVAAVATAAIPRPSPADASAAALAPAALGGRLVLRDGARVLTPRDARRALGGKALSLHLRSGWEVVTARLDEDGFFVAEARPGEWVVESVAAGDLVEFVDPPMALQVRSGEVACAGQLELAFRDLGAELGQGTGHAAVADRCGELSGKLQGAARGRAVRTRVATPVTAQPARRSFWEVEDALRAGLGYRRSSADAGSETRWWATAVVGLNRPNGTSGAVVLAASFAEGEIDGAPTRRIVSAGLGYWLGSLVEVSAGPELQLAGPDGKGGGMFGQLRLGPSPFGVSVRGEYGKGGGMLSYGIDLSPLWLIGGLL